MAEYEKADVFLESVTADAGSCLRDLMVETYALVWKDSFPVFLYHLLKSNTSIDEEGNKRKGPSLADRPSVVQACPKARVDGLLEICRKNNSSIQNVKSGEQLIKALSQYVSEKSNSQEYSGPLKRLSNEIWEEWARRYFQDAQEDEILHILSALDLSACFKINSITYNIDNDIHQQTYVRLFPRLWDSKDNKATWATTNRCAVDIRNRMVGHTQKLTGVAAWREESRYWEEIANRLRRPETEEQYQAFVYAVENGNQRLNMSVIPWKDIEEGCGKPREFCRRILCGIYHYTEDGTNLRCDSLETALNNIYREIQFSKENEQEKEQLVRQQEIQEANPGISMGKVLETVRKESVQKKVKKVIDLNLLSDYKGGFLNMAQLHELCQTHTVLLDSSLLLSGLAETFIAGDLMQAAGGMPANGKAPFVVEAASRFEVFKQRNENKTGGYYLMNDFLYGHMRLIRYVGVPDPFMDRDEATVEFIKNHKQQRICIFTYGNPGFVKRINHSDYPLCAVADVSKNWSDSLHPNVLLFKNTLPLTSRFKKEDAVSLLEKADPEDYPTNPEDNTEPVPAVSTETSPMESEPQTERNELTVPAMENENSCNPEVKLLKKASGMPDPKGLAVVVAQPAEAEEKKLQPKAVMNDQGDPYFYTKQQKPKPPLPPVTPSFVPSEVQAGDILYTAGHLRVRLKRPLMEDGSEAKGGEGALYTTDRNTHITRPDKTITLQLVAKIYHKELRTPERYRKICYMAANPVGSYNVCWPVDVLFDKENNFVGFTMIKAPQGCMQLGTSVFKIGQPGVREEFFPTWQKIDLVKVALTIAKTMSWLHKRNILMGDINPGNILINPRRSGEVYFVDCDSYQVGEFPCPVGREEFTHPGIAARLGTNGKVEYGTFMRTLDDEQYGLAILLFSILMNGQHPYQSKSQDNLTLAMKNKEFPYSKSWRAVPNPSCWMMWKNLPKRIRDPFTNTFENWETASAGKWVALLDSYRNLIQNYGFCNEINPTKYYEANPEAPMFVDLICPDCGREFNCTKSDYARNKNIVCLDCQNYHDWLDVQLPPVSLTCSRCHKTYQGRPSEEELSRKTNARLICPSCRSRKPYTKWRNA